MFKIAMVVVAVAEGVIGLSGIARAAARADYEEAYAAAVQAEERAGALRNQWLPTEAALKAAQKAADQMKYDGAIASAKRAEALAKASIRQAQEQDKLWRQAVIR